MRSGTSLKNLYDCGLDFLLIVVTTESRWDRNWYMYFDNKHIPHYVLTSEDETAFIKARVETDENEVVTQGMIKPFI